VPNFDSTYGLGVMGQKAEIVFGVLWNFGVPYWMVTAAGFAKLVEKGGCTPYRPPSMNRIWLKLTEIMTSQYGDFQCQVGDVTVGGG